MISASVRRRRACSARRRAESRAGRPGNREYRERRRRARGERFGVGVERCRLAAPLDQIRITGVGVSQRSGPDLPDDVRGRADAAGGADAPQIDSQRQLFARPRVLRACRPSQSTRFGRTRERSQWSGTATRRHPRRAAPSAAPNRWSYPRWVAVASSARSAASSSAAGSARASVSALEMRIEHPQRVALEQPQARRLRPASARAVMLVIDDGVGSEPDLVAEEPQPPAELDVLVVGERPLVPAAGIEKHLALHQHRRAAGKQQRRFPSRREPCRRADVMLKTASLEVHGSTAEINQLAVPVENAAADARRALSRGDRQQLGQPVGMDARVVVEKHQVFTGRGAGPDVVGGRESQVRAIADDAGARIGALRPRWSDPRSIRCRR